MKDMWFSKFNIGSHTSGHGESSDHIGFWGSQEAKPHLEKLLELAKVGMWTEEFKHTIKIGLEGNIERKWDAALSSRALFEMPKEGS